MMKAHSLRMQELRTARSRVWMAVMLAAGIPYSAFAGIITDTSLGHASQTLSGNMPITQQMGMVAGANLFQSFQSFNINPGESANFTTSTNGISNVISRVTGGNLSQINGQLSLTPCTGCGSPNFFFINPAGVTFGAGASVNVPGAFHVSTADYVKFPDGKFYADLSKASTFSVAPPEAFGFLGNSRASMTVSDGARLATQPTQPLSVVAGDVTLNNGSVTTNNGGDIRVVAVGQAATEVSFTGALPAANGNLNISNGGYIKADTATTATAGNVNVSAGTINLDGNGTGTLGISSTTSTPNNTGNAGNVNVMATGNISLTNGAVINADTYSAGNGGNVSVQAGSLISDGTVTNPNVTITASSHLSRISSQANPDGTGSSVSTGNCGIVNVTATGNISLKNGASIDGDSYTSGNAGPVTVNAGSVNIDGTGSNNTLFYTGISSQAGGAGNGSFVNVTTAGILSILNGGEVISGIYGIGNAGLVTVNAGSIYINEGSSGGYTGIASQAYTGSTGDSGTVNVTTTGNLSLVNGATISTAANGSGNAGSTTVNAANITIDGQGWNNGFTGISSQANYGTGNGGTVNVSTAGNLSIINSGGISSNTWTSGNAGSVNVNAGTLLVDGIVNGYASKIRASATNGSSGQTGTVTVKANNITLSNGGQITIQNDATVANPTTLTPTSLSVTAPRINIFNDPNAITTSSTGNVDAGSIAINASNMLSLDPSGITTTANQGNGGGININAGTLALNNSQIATSVTGTTGNGGNITVNANSVLMNSGFVQANTAAANASGGTVSITANNLIPAGNTLFIGGNTPYAFQPGTFGFNVIQAAAPTGISGTIHTTSPTLDLSSSLSRLNTKQIDTGGLARSPCQQTGGSSLSMTGRGGLPPSARRLLRAELLLSSTMTRDASSTGDTNMRLALTDWSCS